LSVLGESVCLHCGAGCRLRVEGVPDRVTLIRSVEAAADEPAATAINCIAAQLNLKCGAETTVRRRAPRSLRRRALPTPRTLFPPRIPTPSQPMF